MYVNLDAEKRVLKEQSQYRLRESGYTPAVVFSKGMDSIPLKVKTHELMKCLAQNVAIVEIKVGSEKHLASIEQVQKAVTTPQILHVSFHKLQKGQDALVTLKVHLHGEAKGAANGGVVQLHMDSLDVKGNPMNIPGHIEIDISSLKVDGQIHLKDIPLPNGVKFVEDDMDALVVSCHVPHVKEESAVEEEVAPVEEAEGATETENKEE